MFIPRRPTTLALALCIAAAVTPGCSWLSVRGPVRPADPGVAVDCTETRAAPIADTTLALLTGVAGVATTGVGVAWKSCSGTDWLMCLHSGDRAAIIGAGVGLLAAATAFGFSAASGYRATGLCRDVHLAQRSCAGNDPAACAAVARLFEPDAPSPPSATAAVPPATPPASGPPCSSDAACFGYGRCVLGRCQL